MKIEFPERTAIIEQVQKSLGLAVDGIDGKNTWTKIASELGLEVLYYPESRDSIVRKVQSVLGIVKDGHDGRQTWTSIAEKLSPLKEKPISIITSSDYTEKRYQTPHYTRRLTNELEGVVFHHAEGYYEGTISWCLDPKSEVSYHCLINLDGRRAILANDEHVVWHAGKSVFKGRSLCNSFMMGLSYIGDTNTGKMREGLLRLTNDEILSTLEWLKPRAKKYGWTLDDMTHHRVVSPGRKSDLSPACWDQLHAALKTIL